MDNVKINENKFVFKMSQQLYLDYSREQFTRETFRTLYYMINGFHSGVQRLLLGTKGVGKTVFLKSLLNIAQSFFSDSLITIYADFSMNNHLPSSLILNELKEYLIMKNSIGILKNKLEKKKKHVFIVLDEIQNLYLANSYGKSIIGEISEISSSERIFCIITGTNIYMRDLCFANLAEDKKIEFPNYISLDLNSTKYSPRWFYPFLEDFENFFNFLCKKHSINQNPIEMFIKTGGNPGLLLDYNKCDSQALVLKSNANFKILEAVFKCIKKNSDSNKELSIIEIQEWTKLFKYYNFSNKLDTNENLFPAIYDLVDCGFIRFINEGYEQPLIGFASPLVYLEIKSKIERDF